MARAKSAHTKYPNTPETDLLPEVMHVVELSDGGKVELMAADPLDAMKKADTESEGG